MSSKLKPKEGDWICQSKSCGNVNFSSRSKCNKCGADVQKEWIYKTSGGEIGKQQAEKSGGLFNADDWICKSCGNVNWARRAKCNVCNTSKVAKAENRTGFGGGYKDRDDVVEYKERSESDDEFDEFGLKKKKFRGATNEKSENSNEKVASHDDGEHDESVDDEGEEEEEEDGDLDKYNLLDEDDVEDLVASNNKKSSRERSKQSDSESGSGSSSSSSGDSDSSSGSSGSDSDSDSASSSASSSSASSKGSRHRRPVHRGDDRKNRSRSRSPIDKDREKHSSRR